MTEPEDLGTLVPEKDIPLATQMNLIKRRTERGMKPLHIARVMGLNVSDVEKIVEASGWSSKREVIPDNEDGPLSDLQIKLRDGEAEIIKRLAVEGASRQEAAAFLGKSRGTINSIARMYGIKFPADKSNRRYVRDNAKYRSLDLYIKIKELLIQGLSQRQIAQKLNVGREVVNQCIKHFEKGDKS